jgi:putative flippase GtrA
MTELNAASEAGNSVSVRAAALYARHQTLIKYFVIGATASAIDVLLFLLLYNVVHTTALVAHSISVPTSVLFSFVVNARHNFKTTDHTALRLVSFVIVCTIGYAAGFGVIELCRSFGMSANVGKILSLPVVFALQYILNSRITFYKPRAGAAAERGAA